MPPATDPWIHSRAIPLSINYLREQKQQVFLNLSTYQSNDDNFIISLQW